MHSLRLNFVAVLLPLLTLALSAFAERPAGTLMAEPFVHPGLLNTQADFDRIKAKVDLGEEPWLSGWKMLVSNSHASLTYKPHAEAIVYRGSNKVHAENYSHLYNDIAAAYANAVRWKISGDLAYADKAAEILNTWSSTLTDIQGSPDLYLGAGIYGYEIANAAEILRSYPGWAPGDMARCQHMALTVFYRLNHDFLTTHHGAKIDHYWANWDLCNMASALAIGVFTERRDIYDEAIAYFKSGSGNGAIQNTVWKLYPESNLGQWQESGRDQGHTLFGVALLGSICQMAWNQGDDLFGYDDNRFLKGAEYVAQYNLNHDVPYTPYTNSDVTQPVISDNGRGNSRPCWELVYNHYVRLKGLSAPFIEQSAAKVRPEGGGGNYGAGSGGFDQLGYGTLLFSLDPAPAK